MLGGKYFMEMVLGDDVKKTIVAARGSAACAVSGSATSFICESSRLHVTPKLNTLPVTPVIPRLLEIQIYADLSLTAR